MYIQRINSRSVFKEFINFPEDLYRNDPFFIKPFNDELNAIFRIAEIQRNAAFFLVKEENVVLGRIAAFYPVELGGGLGYFECIDNKKAAQMLLEAAISWLNDYADISIKMMVNPNGRDSGWGILEGGKGFSVHGENYHKPYYLELLSGDSWESDFRMLTYQLAMSDFEPHFWERLAKRSVLNGFRFETFDLKNYRTQLMDIQKIYNQAWSHQPFFTPFNIDDLMKSVPKDAWFWKSAIVSLAYLGAKPVGMLIAIPDLNGILRDLGEGRGWLSKLRLKRKIEKKAFNKLKGLLFGVIPAYQKSSVLPGLVDHFYGQCQQNEHVKSIEFHWIGDFNPSMMQFMERIGAQVVRSHIVLKMIKKTGDKL